MVKINNDVIRKQKRFWSGCLFHPTDAVEDSWGRRILDRISDDKAINIVRVYAMLEDIVYLGEEGEIKYDFRVSDLRLSYLVEHGFNLVISYGGMPDCIAESVANKSSVSKGDTRYKGKLWNSMPPKDYSIWEEVCYEYTKHNIEKFGIEVVSRWYLHCFNEPDLNYFLLAHLPKEDLDTRLSVYCKMYESFTKGLLRASENLKIGGPAIANQLCFLREFLRYVKKNDLRLDYIAVHNYGTYPEFLLSGERIFDSENNIVNHKEYLEVINSEGFSDKEVVIDEWGMCSHGYWNIEECPPFIARENEVYAAYYLKLVRRFIDVDPNVAALMICLSGQHEMTEDFSGFRNFFTLNHFGKPIYNAHLMASKLGDLLLSADVDKDDLYVIPTKTSDGAYSVILSYSSRFFDENIPEYEETLSFEEDLTGKSIRIYCIDREHTNPYRVAEKMGVRYPNDEQKKLLREEGRMKPIFEGVYNGEPIKLRMTANSSYLIQIV